MKTEKEINKEMIDYCKRRIDESKVEGSYYRDTMAILTTGEMCLY